VTVRVTVPAVSRLVRLSFAAKPGDVDMVKFTVSKKPFNSTSDNVDVVESPTLSGPRELGEAETIKSDTLNGTRTECVRAPPVAVTLTV
jgi:hypothetical protein